MSADWDDIKSQINATPAFILDEDQVLTNLRPLHRLRQATDCKVLYSMKALPLMALLRLLKTEVDGFAASSLFEARLARQVLAGEGGIHVTTPGLRKEEFSELAELSSHIAFNSLNQYQHLHDLATGYSKGLRINPHLSMVDDERYDPCRPNSKLGVSIQQLPENLPDRVVGLHFHTVFGCQTFSPLLQTLQALMPVIEANPQLVWLNIGGGYRYDLISDQRPLIALLQQLKQRYALELYLEPGKAIVGNAGYLLSRVIDRFSSQGKEVLVLDTSVNHHPEVFEYQRKPELIEQDTQGKQSAILVGSSCKAGDIFGEFSFDQLPDLGDMLTFSNVGAYSLIKANRFNGYNLPDIYALKEGRLRLQKSYDYASFLDQWY